MKNMIGIDSKPAQNLVESLNELLSSYQVYYQNVRGFHWNIKGTSFFVLHTKFEELYTTAQLAIDEIAERILTLEATPLHTFSQYLKNSRIKEESNCHSAEKTVSNTIENLQTLIKIEREVLKQAGDAGDEGTVDQMTGYIKEQEKMVWMLNAFSK